MYKPLKVFLLVYIGGAVLSLVIILCFVIKYQDNTIREQKQLIRLLYQDVHNKCGQPDPNAIETEQ